MGEPHHQFPQPTRPISSYDTIPYSSFVSDEKNPEKFRIPNNLELPNYSAKQIDDLFSGNMNNFDNNSNSQESSSSEERISFSPSTGKTPKDEKEAVDELLLILIEVMDELNTRSREALLKKFFLEIEREQRLEKFIVARLRQSKVKAISELCEKVEENMKNQSDDSEINDENLIATRSIHESVEELSQKLERFKVRTFEGAEVKEEEITSK